MWTLCSPGGHCVWGKGDTESRAQDGDGLACPPPHQAVSGPLTQDAALLPKNRCDGQPLISSTTWRGVPSPLSCMDTSVHVPRRAFTTSLRPREGEEAADGQKPLCDSSGNGTNDGVAEQGWHSACPRQQILLGWVVSSPQCPLLQVPLPFPALPLISSSPACALQGLRLVTAPDLVLGSSAHYLELPVPTRL